MVACLHPLGAVPVAVPSTVGLRMRTSSSKPWETAHKQGMQGMIEYIKTTYVQPITTQGEPVTAVGYGFTDLRIYPPPSPSSRAPRGRAPQMPESSYRRLVGLINKGK